MLKLNPTTNSGCNLVKSKCAEIHYEISDFSILCLFCGMRFFHYAEFLYHFQQQHFEEFIKTMESTVESSDVTNLTDKNFCDPLELGVADDTDELMRKLEAETIDVKELKAELQEPAPSICKSNNDVPHEDYLSNNDSVEAEELNERSNSSSDEEVLVCKVKVEKSDLKMTKSRRLRKSGKRKRGETKTPDGSDYDLAENITLDDCSNASGSDKSCDEADQEETSYEQNTEDVDWSKPFQPNLLKNHEKRPYKPRNKPNVCSYCGRTFRRRYQLDTHLNIHTGSKPHQCDICGRTFRAVTTLTRHLNTHEQRDAFQCRYCEKAFTHRAALLSHETRHTQERHVPCDECDKYFYTNNQMDTHKRKVHHKVGDSHDEALPYACDLCEKSYRSASMLSTHKFKKHYKTAKYTCEQCDKKFTDEHHLEKHKLIHIESNVDGVTK